MKRVAPVLASGLLASSGLIVVLMPYHAFLSTWFGALFGYALIWKSWKELLLSVMVLAAVLLAFIKPAAGRQLLRQPLTIFILSYAGLHMVLALLFWQPLDPTLAGLATNLRFLALFLVVQLAVLVVPGLAERWRRWLTIALLVSGVVVSVIALLQVMVLPKDFLAVFGYDKFTSIAPFILIDEQAGALRAFATLRGPNTLGMFLLLPMALLAVLAFRRWRLAFAIPLLVLVILAIYLTGSRSAWLGVIVTLGVLAFILLGKVKVLRMVKRYGLVALAACALLIVLAFEYPPLRLAIFHSNPGDPTLTEGSTDAHIVATSTGIVDAATHPFGRGPGQAGPASYYNPEGARIAENYYVQVAQEVGIIGLGLLLAILFIVARKLWRLSMQPNAPPLTLALLASFWGVALINTLLHGWADDPTALTWWGLAGLVLAAHTNKRGTRQQIATTTS